MALPSSGPMRLGADVNVELGLSATAQISLGSVAVRGLYGVPSGAIRLAADGYNKSSMFFATVTSSQQNLNLRTFALNSGWNGVSAVTITVNSGVYIWSDTTATAGLIIDGSWPGGVTLINNGFIIGKGGIGGGTVTGQNPESGGPALSLGVNVNITNNSFIAGGGGGGGCAQQSQNQVVASAGGGAGGGNGGPAGITSGVGGSIGASGTNGTTGGPIGQSASGGAGGRILPGVGGSAVSGGSGQQVVAGLGGGAGGSGSTTVNQIGICSGPGQFGPPRILSSLGGGGGGWGASGGNGYFSQFCAGAGLPSFTSGAGGSAGNAGGTATTFGSAAAGAVGGRAVALNGFTVTWNAFGTRYGAIS